VLRAALDVAPTAYSLGALARYFQRDLGNLHLTVVDAEALDVELDPAGHLYPGFAFDTRASEPRDERCGEVDSLEKAVVVVGPQAERVRAASELASLAVVNILLPVRQLGDPGVEGAVFLLDDEVRLAAATGHCRDALDQRGVGARRADADDDRSVVGVVVEHRPLVGLHEERVVCQHRAAPGAVVRHGRRRRERGRGVRRLLCLFRGATERGDCQ